MNGKIRFSMVDVPILQLSISLLHGGYREGHTSCQLNERRPGRWFVTNQHNIFKRQHPQKKRGIHPIMDLLLVKQYVSAYSSSPNKNESLNPTSGNLHAPHLSVVVLRYGHEVGATGLFAQVELPRITAFRLLQLFPKHFFPLNIRYPNLGIALRR